MHNYFTAENVRKVRLCAVRDPRVSNKIDNTFVFDAVIRKSSSFFKSLVVENEFFVVLYEQNLCLQQLQKVFCFKSLG